MAMVGPTRMNMWPPRMNTEGGLLTLAQWLSPAYPVGAFAYSHGVEDAIANGRLTERQRLQEWLEDLLCFGSGRTDCILLREAHASRDATTLAHVNDTALAFAACAERRLEMTAQGEAFCKTTAAIWGGEDTGHVYCVAVGAAAARLRIDPGLAAALYLQALISNLVSAAQRLMKLGQTEGQRLIATLTPMCQSVAADTKACTLDDLHSAAFLSDIAAMRHETLQPRIFRT
ncbi:MAG: urease accessory protein UreF [Sulfitobacter sp.]